MRRPKRAIAKRPRRCTDSKADGRRCTRAGKYDGKCRQHSDQDGGGRQAEAITPELAARLATYLADGVTIEIACAACKVPRRTVYNWLERAQEVNAPAAYVEFADLIEQARAEGEARNVHIIATAAADDWRAAAWLLERNAPERFAKPSVRPAAQRKAGGDQDVADGDLPDNVVRLPRHNPVADAHW